MSEEEGNVTNDNSGSKVKLLLKTSKRGNFAAGNGNSGDGERWLPAISDNTGGRKRRFSHKC